MYLSVWAWVRQQQYLKNSASL